MITTHLVHKQIPVGVPVNASLDNIDHEPSRRSELGDFTVHRRVKVAYSKQKQVLPQESFIDGASITITC